MVDRFERFSFDLFEIFRCWHKIAAAEMSKYGLKGSHATYLITLYRYADGLNATQLCELCVRDKSDVSRMTAILEKKGLVEKDGVNYRAALKLTDEGKAVAKRVCKRAEFAVKSAGKGISEENRAVLYDTLELIVSNLQSISKEGLPPNNDTP